MKRPSPLLSIHSILPPYFNKKKTIHQQNKKDNFRKYENEKEEKKSPLPTFQHNNQKTKRETTRHTQVTFFFLLYKILHYSTLAVNITCVFNVYLFKKFCSCCNFNLKFRSLKSFNSVSAQSNTRDRPPSTATFRQQAEFSHSFLEGPCWKKHAKRREINITISYFTLITLIP